MSRISDYSTDDCSGSSVFKQNFDLVSPEEIQYNSEVIFQEFEELNRRSCIFGYPFPKQVVDLKRWMEELKLHEEQHEAEFLHQILVIRKVQKLRQS
jgi:hypothetical protein